VSCHINNPSQCVVIELTNQAQRTLSAKRRKASRTHPAGLSLQFTAILLAVISW